MLSPAGGSSSAAVSLWADRCVGALPAAARCGGLYVASLTAESLVEAAHTLPADIERLAGQVSGRINDLIRDQPYLRAILPEPGTIDRLGDTNSALLIEKLSYGLSDFSLWVVQGFIILVLVIFLLVESQMLTTKVIRFFAQTPGERPRSQRHARPGDPQIRAYLVARTLINLGLGLVIALGSVVPERPFRARAGLFAALTNFIPYIGQLVGGALPTRDRPGPDGSIGDALIVAAMYLAVVGIEGYVVTPLVMGRSLDLNGTTVLIACLFWGFLWGLIGLILAMPITVSMKLVFQTVPELNRWAELMSLDWQSPEPSTACRPGPTQADRGRRPARDPESTAVALRTVSTGTVARLPGGLRWTRASQARARRRSGCERRDLLKETCPMEVVSNTARFETTSLRPSV